MSDSRISPSLFSRLLLIVAVAASLVAAYWVVAQALEPVPIPELPRTAPTVRFDPKADVSQHPVFEQLQPIGPATVERGPVGRQNPFVPAATSSAATITR